jgi:hypothetical protein
MTRRRGYKRAASTGHLSEEAARKEERDFDRDGRSGAHPCQDLLALGVTPEIADVPLIYMR